MIGEATARRDAGTPAPSPAPALAIRGLSVEYRTDRGRLRALRDIELEIAPGRVLGVVGESGCGKSTLIASVLRLPAANAEVTAGSIRLEGRELLELSEREMRALRGDRVAVVFQDPTAALHPVLSIGAQMLDVQHRSSASRREKLERAAAMLVRVGIADARTSLERHCHQLSGGMRQRVAIAMALLARPALLIADEPTSALDATTKAQILALLRELQEEVGCAVLFVSHHLGEIAQICDDVVVIYAGEVVERASVRELFARAAHPYTRALLECDPARRRRGERVLPTIPGSVPDLVELPSGCAFASRCPEVFDRCRREVPRGVEVVAGRVAAEHRPTGHGAPRHADRAGTDRDGGDHAAAAHAAACHLLDPPERRR
ncbi:MAG TPA: ABC transporter ATP-binding protein [Thermoanaerobaculia bacterium]|nr:ABC transporter ATP-binding protein [Thermoanaerobaculia bacterium]